MSPTSSIRIENIIAVEEMVQKELTPENMRKAKRTGFTDEQIARLVKKSREEITDLRHEWGIIPTYKMVDTCAAEFEAKTPYYYSTYDTECELRPSDRKKVLILAIGTDTDRTGNRVRLLHRSCRACSPRAGHRGPYREQ